MFDVSWSDPSGETVGQRRSRKEHDKGSVSSDIRRSPSLSSDKSRTKRRPSILTLFNGNKKDFSRPASRANLSAQRREAASEPLPNRADGVHNAVSLIQELPPGTLTADKLIDGLMVTELPAPGERDNYSPSDEPAFTSWASRSASIDSTWSSMAESPRRSNFVQPLSPTSFVTQRTEITIASREDVKENEHNVTVVHISADGQELSTKRNVPPQISPSSSTSEFQLPEFSPSEKYAGFTWFENAGPQSLNKITMGNMAANTRWKPPENWECPSMLIPPPKSSARPSWRPESQENNLPGSNVFQLQKTIKRMRTATLKIMLERLKEEWTDPTEGSIDEEFEFERKLWMRTALNACAEMSMEENVAFHRRAREHGSTSPKIAKILSLHQDHASLAFLSTHNPPPATEIHHLSTTNFASPTVYTLTVHSPKPTFSYGTSIFASIHASLSLPSLYPSPALPALLKECHRVLRPRSPLHITLIDPSALSASTGPRLRAWLDTNLVLELERKFRCTNPCRLLPGWLAEAGFASAGSGLGITRWRFAAAMETALVASYSRSEGRAADWAAEETREELKAVVGRGLWEECWGAYCVEGRRWWDDGGVMEECVEMGTLWEVLVVEATRGE